MRLGRRTPFDWLIVGLGNPGKEYVRTHFLMPRYLRDYLRIIGEVV